HDNHREVGGAYRDEHRRARGLEGDLRQRSQRRHPGQSGARRAGRPAEVERASLPFADSAKGRCPRLTRAEGSYGTIVRNTPSVGVRRRHLPRGAGEGGLNDLNDLNGLEWTADQPSTTSVPAISSWPSPQKTSQKKTKLPGFCGVIVTRVSWSGTISVRMPN